MTTARASPAPVDLKMSVEVPSPFQRIIAQLEREDPKAVPGGGDLQFLRRLAIRGDLVFETGNVVNPGDSVSVTPVNGSTFFLQKALFANKTNGQVADLELKINGNTIEIIRPAAFEKGEFNSQLLMVTGDGTASAEVEVSGNNFGAGGADITLIGWFENTENIRSEIRQI